MRKAIFFTLLLFVVYGFSSVKKGNTWLSPEYTPITYHKIVVLARLNDQTDRRQLEDAMVRGLKDKGINAVTSYLNIGADDLASEEQFIAKCDSLNIDGLVAFTGTDQYTEYSQGPSINAHVGVPVRIGFFNVYLGGNVPIASGTRQKQVMNLTASFYNKQSRSPQWTLQLTGTSKNGTGDMAKKIADVTGKELERSGVILLP